MAFVYAVLGGGRQGTAAAYDMAKFGDAAQVLIADLSLEAAQKSVARVNASFTFAMSSPSAKSWPRWSSRDAAKNRDSGDRGTPS